MQRAKEASRQQLQQGEMSGGRKELPVQGQERETERERDWIGRAAAYAIGEPGRRHMQRTL